MLSTNKKKGAPSGSVMASHQLGLAMILEVSILDGMDGGIGKYRQVSDGWPSSLYLPHGLIKPLHFQKSAFFLMKIKGVFF
jgi:hypothetical protein